MAHDVAVYEVRLMITQPIEDDEAQEAYASTVAKHNLEKMIVRHLRKMDGDADCEVVDVTFSRES